MRLSWGLYGCGAAPPLGHEHDLCGFGKGGGALLQSVAGTDFVGYDTSLSLPLYSSFRFGTQMCCATLAKLLN